MGLDVVLRHRVLTICVGYGLLATTIAVLWPVLRREFFPEVDAGAFEMYVRAHSGLRIEETEKRIKEVEDFVRKKIEPEDLQLVLSELGVTSDWSAAYTLNAGPMDAVMKIQLSAERSKSAQEYVHILRTAFAQSREFSDLEFAFDAGGMVRSAMNEGRSTPISIRVTGKDQETAQKIATAIKGEVKQIDGVVDARIIQRLDYPEYLIKVDRAKAAELGLTQADVMKNVVAAFNSSIRSTSIISGSIPRARTSTSPGSSTTSRTSSRSIPSSTSWSRRRVPICPRSRYRFEPSSRSSRRAFPPKSPTTTSSRPSN